MKTRNKQYSYLHSLFVSLFLKLGSGFCLLLETPLLKEPLVILRLLLPHSPLPLSLLSCSYFRDLAIVPPLLSPHPLLPCLILLLARTLLHPSPLLTVGEQGFFVAFLSGVLGRGYGGGQVS